MTLTGRLTLLLLAVFVGLCGVLLYHSSKSAERYFQHVTQQISAPIAMYVAENRPPFRAGAFDAAEFRDLAAMAMILNPSIEVYALDAAGRVLAHRGHTRTLARDRVDLVPLRQFIGRRAEDRTLLGDDPRHPSAKHIFSAAAVGPLQNPWGYVYVILDSNARQETSARAWTRHAAAFAGGGIAVILLAGFVVAALLFGRLAVPLRSLARDVSELDEQVSALPRESAGSERDELACLRKGFQRMRARITAQMQALQRADASRREWIAHLSHDLRAPLATLQAHLEHVLRRDGVASASERREGVARGLLHCTQIRGLLAELFESARLAAPTLELRREPFALGELAQDAAVGLRAVAETSGVRIECETDGQDSTVLADINLFQRLIDNLLTNAIKASPRGSALTIGVHRVRDTVSLTVTDCGAGPTSDMLRVFSRAEDPAIGAAGLGLRIVAQILRLHDLRSTVTPLAGGGSIVRIDVPATGDIAVTRSAARAFASH